MQDAIFPARSGPALELRAPGWARINMEKTVDRLASDEELLRAISAGDAVALTLLMDRHVGHLMTYVKRMVSSKSREEDVWQETVYAVWTSAATYHGQSTVRTWLFGIARRQALRLCPVEWCKLPMARDTRKAIVRFSWK